MHSLGVAHQVVNDVVEVQTRVARRQRQFTLLSQWQRP